MRRLGRFLLAIVIVAGTTAEILFIARQKNVGAAGGDVYRLGPDHPQAFEGWRHLLSHLDRVGETDLRQRLEERREAGEVWIAPSLPHEQRAVWISTLGIVERIYVAERELTWLPERLYPRLNVPPPYLHEFAWVTLASTLFHELAHARGITSEAGAYEAELQWLRRLPSNPVPAEHAAEERRAFAWAIQTAIADAEKARARATGP